MPRLLLMNSLISIVIPSKELDPYAKKCVNQCEQLVYESYEIVLLSDDTSTEIEDVNVISTGPITPGAKRNIGIPNSKGGLCAFFDFDAYPRVDYHFTPQNILRIPILQPYGPRLTPVHLCEDV